MKYLWFLCSILSYVHCATAQNTKQHYANANEKIAFCYENKLFPKRKAYFSRSANFFRVHRANKKILKLKIPKQITPYLLHLARNKKPKLKAIDLLFIEQGLLAWKNKCSMASFDTTSIGVHIKIITKGKGKKARKNKKIAFKYVGRFKNGQIFDASNQQKKIYEGLLGEGKLISGLDQGLIGLEEGTKAILRIPPEQGYGDQPYGKIPAHSTLYYEITILRVE